MLQSGQVQQPVKDRHKRFVPVEGKYKAIAEAASPPRGILDVLESDSDDGTGPGPGAYFEGQTSGFRLETKPKRLQFFGSTVERFVEGTKQFK